MQKAEKSKYTSIVRDGGEDGCFYCSSTRGGMYDYTPNGAASDEDKANFDDEWTVALCCSSCWRRIYSANIARVNNTYVGANGMMTIEQKQVLVGGAAKKKQVRNVMRTASPNFTLWPDLDLILPVGAVLIGNSIQIGAHAYTHEELRILQPAIWGAFLNRPTESVILAHSQAMRDLDPSKLHVYEEMLGLPGTSPSGSTF